MTAEDVLDEFHAWLGEQPETPAKRWVQANPPTQQHAVQAILVVGMLATAA